MMDKLSSLYRDVLSYLRRELRRPLLAALICLVLGIILGVGVGTAVPHSIDDAMASFEAQVREAGIIGRDGSLSMAGLLANNWRAMLIAFLCGAVPFLYLPAVSLLTNGMLLGLLGTRFVTEGRGLLYYLAGILPHGIFEVAALVLSAACGVALCRYMKRLVTSDPQRQSAAQLLSELLRVMLLVVAPLTVLAAGVEAHLTPLILSLFP